MKNFTNPLSGSISGLWASLLLVALPTFAVQPSLAAEVPKAIEQALTQAQADKRGITLHVSGQAIGGAVTRIEPGQVVELRGPAGSRIVVRIDRIDGITAP